MTNESKTLYIPLYGKAIMSKEGFFEDKTAENIVDTCGYDFADVDASKRLAIYMAMRAMRFDELADRFIAKHKNCIVIQLGCGLDSRCERVEARPKMWYDLDFPEVIDIRREYFSDNEGYRLVSSSVTNHYWLNKIEYHGEPVLVIAEGLSMYLTKEELTSLMDEFAKCFSVTMFMFDAYSDFAAKASKFKNPINAVDAKISFSMDDCAVLTDEVEGAQCVLDSDIIQPEYINRLSGIYKTRFRFMRKAGAKMYRIYGIKIKREK